MQITVANIPDAGKTVHFKENPSWAVDVATTVLGGPASTCSGQLVFEKKGRLVVVTGAVNAQARCTCERCGEEVEVNLSAPTSLSYLPTGSSSSSESELSERDLDVGWYEAGIVELADVVSEALALALPERLICLDVEGCEGRTAALLASARVDAESGHPGFSVLKDL